MQKSRRENKDVEAVRRWLDEEQQEAQIKDKSSVKIDFIVKPTMYFRPFSVHESGEETHKRSRLHLSSHF